MKFREFKFVLFNLVIILIVAGCSNPNSTESINLIRLQRNLHDNFISIIEEDNIKYESLLVNIVKSENMTKGIIYWTPKFYPHQDFVLSYNEMILGELQDSLTNQLDSIILEIEIKDSEFGLKRYRASSSELKGLREIQSEIPKKYFDFLHFVAKKDFVIEIQFFDNLLSGFYETATWDSKAENLDWMNNGFLIYTKYLFMSVTDKKNIPAETSILRDFIGTGATWHERSNAVEIVNYLLNELDQPPLEPLDSTKSDFSLE